MIKKILALTLALCMAISLCSCFSSSKNAEYPFILGHTEIKASPADGKVAVLDDSVADVILACGYSKKIGGISTDCTQKELKDIKKIGTKAAPDVSAILALKPSIIFIDNNTPKDAKEAFEKENIPTVQMACATTRAELESLYSGVCSILEGKITGAKKGLNEIAKQIKAIDDFSATIPEAAVTKSVAYLYDDKGSAVTGDTFGNLIIQCAGGTNSLEKHFGDKVNFTELANIDPTYIFCSEGMADKIKNNGVLATLSAIKNNKIYEMPAYYMTRQGATMVQSIEFMAKKMFPSLSKGEPTDKNATSLVEKYGFELYEGLALYYGESGDNIYIMQTRLDDLGFLSIDPTGEYLDNTVTAVKEFKEYNGITPTDGNSMDEAALKKLFSSGALERDTPARAEVPTLPNTTEPITAVTVPNPTAVAEPTTAAATEQTQGDTTNRASAPSADH